MDTPSGPRGLRETFKSSRSTRPVCVCVCVCAHVCVCVVTQRLMCLREQVRVHVILSGISSVYFHALMFTQDKVVNIFM